MKWLRPPIGARRTRIRFAWLPVEMDREKSKSYPGPTPVIWLERYTVTEERQDGVDGVRWYVVQRRALR